MFLTMKYRLLALVVAWCLVFVSSAKVMITRTDYRGWKDSVRMSNGQVDLVFVPQIGRIMRYGYVDGPNMLWEDPELAGKVAPATPGEWRNYGGDKLWPAPQALWNWPPDTDLDGGVHQVEIKGTKLIVTSPTSERFGIRFQREISLAGRGSEVTMRNRMMNVGSKPVELAIWQIAQMDDPDVSLLPIEKTTDHPLGWGTYGDLKMDAPEFRATSDMLFIKRNRASSVKVGAGARAGYVAAEKGDVRFTMFGPYQPGMKYPDGGKAQQIYTNPDPKKYVELELNGPIEVLRPGQSSRFNTRWSLVRLAK